MAKKLEIKITIGGVETAYNIAPPEWIKWERHTGKSITQAADSLGMDDLAFLAYHSMKRQSAGSTVPTLDVWENTIEEISGGKPTDPLATAQIV